MAAKIRVLNEQTINEIAAGEVIENPASVVKELVENALDAEATEIAVEIRGGGRQLIRIADNGCGMSGDDALLCLERHATSKIKEAADIFELRTMGFRGEALPSIASISKFSLLTAERGSEEGTLVLIEGGRIISCGAAVRAPGTTMEVKQLFFNVPVRRKFQRSPAYDTQEIEKICTALALANPSIAFQLISNQEVLWRTPEVVPSLSHKEALGARIQTLLGDAIYKALCPLEIESEGIKLTGFVALPHLHRPNRGSQYLLINGRWVTAPFLSYCVKEGYGTLLPTNRYPVFVLALELPVGTVDVNVHPQKREVRFLHEGKLRELVRRGVAEALYGGGVSEIPTPPSVEEPLQRAVNYTDFEKVWLPSLDSLREKDETTSYVPPPSPAIEAPKPLPWDKISPPPLAAVTAPPLPLSEFPCPIPSLVATLPGYLLLDPSAATRTVLLSRPSSLPPALFLVDQRLAHQRVLYEQLTAAISASQRQALEIQTLLIPPNFDCSSADSALLRENCESLATLGISLHQIGPHSWSIETLPTCLGDVDYARLFEQLLADWRQSASHKVTFDTLLAKQLCNAAGRAAISSGRRLAIEEGTFLLRQLCRCKQPAHCPSGLPTALCISYEELQRRFTERL